MAGLGRGLSSHVNPFTNISAAWQWGEQSCLLVWSVWGPDLITLISLNDFRPPLPLRLPLQKSKMKIPDSLDDTKHDSTFVDGTSMKC